MKPMISPKFSKMKLREEGVECAATRRQHRGQTIKPENGLLRAMRQRGVAGNVHQQQAAELVKAFQNSERPKHPYFQEVMKTRGYILAEYGLIAKELYKMGHKSEARIISQLAKDMAGQPVTTKAQQQYDNVQGRLNGQEKQHEYSQDSEHLR